MLRLVYVISVIVAVGGVADTDGVCTGQLCDAHSNDGDYQSLLVAPKHAWKAREAKATNTSVNVTGNKVEAAKFNISAVVISLDGHHDRWETISRGLANSTPWVNFDRMDVIESHKISAPEEDVSAFWNTTSTKMAHHPRAHAPDVMKMTPRELRSCSSHIAAWRKAVEMDSPLVVVEDDAVILPNFTALLEQAVQEAPRETAMIFLNHVEQEYTEPSGKLLGEPRLVSSTGYVIFPAGARQLLHLLPINMPVENWLTIRVHRGEIKALSMRGPLLVQEHKRKYSDDSRPSRNEAHGNYHDDVGNLSPKDHSKMKVDKVPNSTGAVFNVSKRSNRRKRVSAKLATATTWMNNAWNLKSEEGSEKKIQATGKNAQKQKKSETNQTGTKTSRTMERKTQKEKKGQTNHTKRWNVVKKEGHSKRTARGTVQQQKSGRGHRTGAWKDVSREANRTKLHGDSHKKIEENHTKFHGEGHVKHHGESHAKSEANPTKFRGEAHTKIHGESHAKPKGNSTKFHEEGHTKFDEKSHAKNEANHTKFHGEGHTRLHRESHTKNEANYTKSHGESHTKFYGESHLNDEANHTEFHGESDAKLHGETYTKDEANHTKIHGESHTKFSGVNHTKSNRTGGGLALEEKATALTDAGRDENQTVGNNEPREAGKANRTPGRYELREISLKSNGTKGLNQTAAPEVEE